MHDFKAASKVKLWQNMAAPRGMAEIRTKASE
jgi:hypothetical protein